MTRASIIRGSVNIKSAGSPMKWVNELQLQPGAKALFCTVYGKATGLVKRTDPKDPDKFYYGLRGTFEVLPAKEGAEVVGGANLFAPDAIHNMIADQIEKGAKTVSFLFEAYVVAGGQAGFTWEYKFADNGTPEEDDVLSDLRSLIPGRIAPKLEAPKKVKAA